MFDEPKNPREPRPRHGSAASGIDHTGGREIQSDPSSDEYLKASNLNFLLGKSDEDLNAYLQSVDAVRLASILNVFGRMAHEDIQSRGDYALAIRLAGGLERRSAGQLLTWIFQSKSPMGWKFDLSEQQKIVGLVSNGKPSDFLQKNFLRKFGLIHGADVAASKEPVPLTEREFLNYISGVCQVGREAVFQNIEMVQDEKTKRIACELATPILLNSDAIGFSQYLGNMAPSGTKDIAILQMIKWLVKRDSKSDSQPWLNAIGSHAIRDEATKIIDPSRGH